MPLQGALLPWNVTRYGRDRGARGADFEENVMAQPGLNHDIKLAKQNWADWRDVFEFTGNPAENPLLADSQRFRKFLREYAVVRTIRSGESDHLRQHLRSDGYALSTLLNDKSGHTLDVHERELRRSFGARNGSSILSALSKVSAFLAPHIYIAWDSYARKGLKKISPHTKADSYANYLAALNEILKCEVGQQLRASCQNQYPTERKEAFERRVLDTYLMRLGGRSF